MEPSQISVVDDDRSFRDSMRRLLKSLNYAVAVFPSATEFLASPKLDLTACLIADIHMPAMTGVELCKHLIANGNLIPTILVTGYPDDGVEQSSQALGAECFLRKPLVESALIDCLRTALARGRGSHKGP